MSTRDTPRDSTRPIVNLMPKRIEPSILEYVHPGHKKGEESRHGSASSKKENKRSQSRRNKKSKQDDRTSVTQVQLSDFEGSSVPRLWSTTGVMNSTTLSGEKRSQGGGLFPPSPVMPRFRNIIESETKLSPSPFGGSKTLPITTAPRSFSETVELPPVRLSPRVQDGMEKKMRKEKKKKSKRHSERKGVSRSSDDTEC